MTYNTPKSYTGNLTYWQEYGYKMIMLEINLEANERSRVIRHKDGVKFLEDIANQENGKDIYHFHVDDQSGEKIQLIIDALHGSRETWFAARDNDIVTFQGGKEPAAIPVNVIRSKESVLDAHSREGLDEALTYYANDIPRWLNETTTRLPDVSKDDHHFGR